MNPNRHVLFASNLADVVSVVDGGLLIGTYGWQNSNFNADAPTCEIICRQECTPQVYRVLFGDPEDVCNACNKSAGIGIELVRDPLFKSEKFRDIDTRLTFPYPFGTGNSTVTAAMVAANVIDQINNPRQYGHNHFGITASLDASDSNNETILITIDDCTRFRVHNLPGSTENTITEMTAGLDAVVSADWALRQFPLQVGTAMVPGAGPDESWQGCKRPCIITFTGCIENCAGAGLFQHWNMFAMNPRVALTVIFDQDATDPLWLEESGLTCTQNCRVTYSGASFGTLTAGAKSNTVLGSTFNVTVVSGDTALEYATKLQTAILANCAAALSCYVSFDGSNYNVVIEGDGTVNLLRPMTINSIVFAPESVAGFACGCYIDETPAYPFTGIFIYNDAGDYIPITAAANVAAIVSTIDAVLNPVSVIATSQRLVLSFPPDTNATVDCGALKLVVEPA